ncbi:hypothetical protein BH11PLA1_BH11PLA1_12010 [soil metagenome]
MDTATIFEAFGWLGSALLVMAYALKDHPRYIAIGIVNILGATFLGLSLYYKHAWPGLALEFVWIGIAVWGMLKPRKPHPGRVAT